MAYIIFGKLVTNAIIWQEFDNSIYQAFFKKIVNQELESSKMNVAG